VRFVPACEEGTIHFVGRDHSCDNRSAFIARLLYAGNPDEEFIRSLGIEPRYEPGMWDAQLT
jgi:hypothetical protein